MSTAPVEALRLQALEERDHLREITTELKAKLSVTGLKNDVAHTAGEHIASASLAAALIAFIAGYGVAAVLTS